MCFPVNYILLLCISKLSVLGSVKTSCLSFTCRWSRSVSYQRWLRQRWTTIDSPWRSWRSSMAKYRTGIFNYMLQISLKPSHIPSQSSFCIFPCIFLSSRKICCEYIIAMFLANMHWVYAHIFCSRRISTASSRPKKEFKPKSMVSSLETVENTQHNGLTHTSSVKSTGIDKKTSQLVCFSLRMKSEHMQNLKCFFLYFNITFSGCNFSRSWNKLLLSRIT